ncbi:MAG: NAD(P)H-hydrate dehydratase [Anaeroplasma sp.]
MKSILTVKNMRKSDEYTISNGVPSQELMWRAALGVYNNVNWHGNIGIFCGGGNNAGDGYALALILKENNYNVNIVLINNNFSNDGKYYFDLCLKNNINIIDINDNLVNYDIAVDAILGTGFKGDLKEEYNKAINIINQNKYIVSIDINSGLNGDNGLAINAVKSDLTVSIGYLKPGLYLNMAKDYIKKIINVDIGIRAVKDVYYLIEESDFSNIFKPRLNFTNKGSYGYVGILGGSTNYPGAIRLANLAQTALYSGCGVSRVIIPDCIYNLVFNNVLEATVYSMPSDGKMMLYDELELKSAIKGLRALGVGIGWSESREYEKILEYLIVNFNNSLVIDADGLNTLAKMDLDLLNKSNNKIILTPHLKELSRLTGYEIKYLNENLIDVALEFTNKYNVILLVKGPTTIIAYKNDIFMVNKGCSGMATAGSGDVLTGILVGMLGYSDDTFLTTALAAYLNGYAGELAMKEYCDISMVSSDTAKMLKYAIKNIKNNLLKL